MKEDTLPKLFLRNRDLYNDRIALRYKVLGIWKPVTWKDYWSHVCFFALGLKKLGLNAGDKIAILGYNCQEWLYSDLAAQCSSAISVGIYPTSVASQVKYTLKNSESKFVVAKDQEQVDKILEVKHELPELKKIIVIDTKGLKGYREPMIITFKEVETLGEALNAEQPQLFENMIKDTKPEDIATLIYTSGTTGKPKGAMISQKNILTMARNFSKVMEFRSTDSFVSAMPLCHAGERMWSLIFPVFAGCTVNFAESLATFLEDVRDISPSCFFFVPRYWGKMYSNIMTKIDGVGFLKRWIFNSMLSIGMHVAEFKFKGKTLPIYLKILNGIGYLVLFRSLRNEIGSLQSRLFLSGAAPMAPDIMKFFHAIGCPVRESYGLTESCGQAFIPRDGEVKIGSVGKPIPGIEFKLLEDGEILLRGESIFVGYYGNPDATKEAIIDGWLHTGDLGQIDEGGQLHITGRKKDIIITAAGKNITPSEIESGIKSSQFIKEAIVVGDGRKYLTCLIQINFENVSNWAQKNQIAYTDYKSLATHPEVKKLIQGEIDKANSSFARVETIKKFTILEKELSLEADEVTATMKVKRFNIQKKYKDIIDAMY